MPRFSPGEVGRREEDLFLDGPRPREERPVVESLLWPGRGDEEEFGPGVAERPVEFGKRRS